MIAEKQNQTEFTHSEQEIIDQIWLNEEDLARASTLSPKLAAQVAADFVSFDAQGKTIEKSQFVAKIGQATKSKFTRLWGHFGSDDSCCLAYLREQNNGGVDMCMALWIERDGTWRKAFHHENEKFG